MWYGLFPRCTGQAQECDAVTKVREVADSGTRSQRVPPSRTLLYRACLLSARARPSCSGGPHPTSGNTAGAASGWSCLIRKRSNKKENSAAKCGTDKLDEQCHLSHLYCLPSPHLAIPLRCGRPSSKPVVQIHASHACPPAPPTQRCGCDRERRCCATPSLPLAASPSPSHCRTKKKHALVRRRRPRRRCAAPSRQRRRPKKASTHIHGRGRATDQGPLLPESPV